MIEGTEQALSLIGLMAAQSFWGMWVKELLNSI